MTRFLDLEQWPRRAAFEFFRGYDNPYFNVCAPLDATALVELSRSTPDVSFSLAALHLAVRAANECEPFRYRLADGQVLVHDRIHIGTTALLEGDRLAFVYYDYHEDFASFCDGAVRAKDALGRSAGDIDAQADRTDLIHFSSLPWVAFTSISHARNWKREDSVPKITFGRYHRVGARIDMPVSVEVHHGLMDGVHVGQYFERLQRHLSDPGPALRRGGSIAGNDRR
jgi:chloramphenicol O-acetyltransferase type A